MRIAPKQYAAFLYEMTHSAKGAELKKAAASFIQLLARSRVLNMLSRIERMYRDYYNSKEGVVDVEVVSARDIQRKIVQEIKVPARKVESTFRIDKALLGGARIRVGDYMMDDTLKARLVRLKIKLYGR